MQARKTFVEMQKDMFETKGALENTIKEHRESVKKSRLIESEINVCWNCCIILYRALVMIAELCPKVLAGKLKDAQTTANLMLSQRRKWEEQLQVISSRIDSVPGHAMLCAAGVCYLARAPPDQHRELLDNWLDYCSGAVPLGSLAAKQPKLHSTQVSGSHR